MYVKHTVSLNKQPVIYGVLKCFNTALKSKKTFSILQVIFSFLNSEAWMFLDKLVYRDVISMHKTNCDNCGYFSSHGANLADNSGN